MFCEVYDTGSPAQEVSELTAHRERVSQQHG